MIAREPTQQFVHRDAQRLAFNVPQSEVNSAQRVEFLATRRIEVSAKHHLPEVLRAKWVLANDHCGALLDGIL